MSEKEPVPTREPVPAQSKSATTQGEPAEETVISVEGELIMDDPPQVQPTVAELQAQLRERELFVKQIQSRVEDLERRMRAEFQESRARLERDFAQRSEARKEDLVRDLLAVFDNLDLTLEAANQGQPAENLAGGVAATKRLLLQALQRHGFERIEAVGQPFDPMVHEAIEVVEVVGSQAGLVVSQLRAGYRSAKQLLRPAMVRVGKAKAQSENA